MAAAVREGERGTDMSEGIGECHASGLFKSKAHRFEARYDRRFPNPLGTVEGYGARTVEAFKEQIYVYDVCTKCGAVVQRGE